MKKSTNPKHTAPELLPQIPQHHIPDRVPQGAAPLLNSASHLRVSEPHRKHELSVAGFLDRPNGLTAAHVPLHCSGAFHCMAPPPFVCSPAGGHVG